MILLYTLLLFLLGVAGFFIHRRVTSLERKYYRIATDADQLARKAATRPGNASRADPLQIARSQYELGCLVQKRDRLEARYASWQKWSKRLGNWISSVRTWKGKKLPYTFGVLDVSLVLYAIDELAVGKYINAKRLLETVTELVAK